MNCTPQPYQITTFSYKGKEKKDKLPETDYEFKAMVWEKSKNELKKFPLWFQKEFVEYWLTVPDCETKNRYFLLTKDARRKWSTLGRMATCKRTIYANDSRWKASKMKPKEIDYTSPRLANMDEYSPINYDAYKERIGKEERSGEPLRLGERLKQNFGR